MLSKNIIVGVTGGIAAYKAADVVSCLVQAGANVQVVMSASAKQFVTSTTFQALSGKPVRDDLWDPAAEAAMGHIELAKWADLIVITPASADFIAKLSHGIADNLLLTLCLATSAPIAIAPAMNQQMWHNPLTQINIQTLQAIGLYIWGPAAGRQACGDNGYGRMLEPADIINNINQLLVPEQLLAGKKILVTAGPTQEFFDQVRFITNRGSGKMGYAMAQAAQQLGAKVTLVSGPVSLQSPATVELIKTVSANDMYNAVMDNIEGTDIFIATAAVADLSPQQKHTQKMTKQELNDKLSLALTKDIVADVAKLTARPFVVGFAAETIELINKAKNKLTNKKLDMIIANQVDGDDIGFESDDNAVTVLLKSGAKPIQFDKAPKKILAQQLMKLITENYYAAKNST